MEKNCFDFARSAEKIFGIAFVPSAENLFEIAFALCAENLFSIYVRAESEEFF